MNIMIWSAKIVTVLYCLNISINFVLIKFEEKSIVGQFI